MCMYMHVFQYRKVESQGLPLACLLLPMVCCSALYFSLNHAKDLASEWGGGGGGEKSKEGRERGIVEGGEGGERESDRLIQL